LAQVVSLLQSLDGQGSLCGGRDPALGVEWAHIDVVSTQPIDTGRREDRGVDISASNFLESRIDVAPELDHLEIRSKLE
jgi:hypothetical protein